MSKKRNRLIHFAYKSIGKPYEYGARHYEAPRKFDCSSFVQYLYKRIGFEIPRSALKQAAKGREVDLTKEDLKIGDLLFFKGSIGHYDKNFPIGIGHVVIYIGNKKIIHASGEEGRVLEEPVDKFLKREDLVVTKRILKN